MKRTLRTLLTVAIVCLVSLPALATLEGDVNVVLRDKLLTNATVGIHIVALPAGGPGQSVYKLKSDSPLIPASNLKIITTSAALDQFGPAFKFRTLLVQRDEDLILIGDGDPTFGDVELLKKVGWGATTVFDNWAKELAKAGPMAVRNVLVDDSIFDEAFVHPAWDPKQLHSRFSAEIAGMTLNAACVDFFVHTSASGRPVTYTTAPPTRYITVQNSCITGASQAITLSRIGNTNTIALKGSCRHSLVEPESIPIHDPALLAATVLAESLGSAGIKVKAVGRDRTVRATLTPDSKVLAMHETPLIQAIDRANKDSMNLYAESLCKRLGAAASGQTGSWVNGAAAVSAFLKKIGINEGQFHIDDGSGLSRNNTISTDAMVRVLEYNFYGQNRDAFVDSLAVPGQEGTLKKRFEGSDLRTRVFAKTGFINNVSALSGYLKTRDDQWFAFSILMNGLPRGTNSHAKLLQEAVVKAIDANARPPGR